MKYLDPKNDLIFQKVFGEYPDSLRSFLNSMLPLPKGQEIVELECSVQTTGVLYCFISLDQTT